MRLNLLPRSNLSFWGKHCESGDENSAKIASVDDEPATFGQRVQNAILRRTCAAIGRDGVLRVYVQLRNPTTRSFGAAPCQPDGAEGVEIGSDD